MRVNDRTVDGKPTLFVEEIQSDWHQAGRKKGYFSRNKLNELDAKLKENGSLSPEDAVEYNRLVDQEAFLATQGGVPDAPFKTNWHELTLKKAINEAATKGYDQIAFTTGATQANRYDLSRQVDKIDIPIVNADGTRSVRIDPRESTTIKLTVDQNGIATGYGFHSRQFSGKALDEIIGKDLAQKVMGANTGQSFSGGDLEVGGEGMKGFYDKILPKSLEKLGKKYNVKPVLTEMDTPDGKVKVWKFPVPKEMAETVKKQGQPLFQIGAGAVGLGTAGLLGLSEEEQF
jgi:hypothetical protein